MVDKNEPHKKDHFKKKISNKPTQGVTGSFVVTNNNNQQTYQMKRSVLEPEVSWKRRYKARSVDKENFGEVIAATIAQSMGYSCPEVDLVYGNSHNPKEITSVRIVSKYLSGDKLRTLDEYAQESGKKLPIEMKKGKEKEGHIKVVHGIPTSTDFSVSDMDKFGLMSSLSDALALSIVMGDDDVNPGNMMVVDKNNKSAITRIDFGHAFNDLLDAPTIGFGGQRQGLLGDINFDGNHVINFLNREKVAGEGGGSVSKLWKNYPGLVPSQALADSFEKIALTTKEQIQDGIRNVYYKFAELLQEMEIKDDKKGIKHVNDSLERIYKNITNKPLNNNETTLQQTCEEVGRFVLENCEKMHEAAKMMKLQLAIEKAIQNNTALPQNTGGDKEIQWIKMSDYFQAYHGTFEGYVAKRKNEIAELKERLQDAPYNIVKYKKVVKDSLTELENTVGKKKDKANSVKYQAVESAKGIMEYIEKNQKIERRTFLKGLDVRIAGLETTISKLEERASVKWIKKINNNLTSNTKSGLKEYVTKLKTLSLMIKKETDLYTALEEKNRPNAALEKEKLLGFYFPDAKKENLQRLQPEADDLNLLNANQVYENNQEQLQDELDLFQEQLFDDDLVLVNPSRRLALYQRQEYDQWSNNNNNDDSKQEFVDDPIIEEEDEHIEPKSLTTE